MFSNGLKIGFKQEAATKFKQSMKQQRAKSQNTGSDKHRVIMLTRSTESKASVSVSTTLKESVLT